MHHQRFSEGDHTLLGSGNRSLQDEEVVLDDTVMREATHGCDHLFSDVRFCGGVTVVVSRTDAVDLLVELGTVVVTV